MRGSLEGLVADAADVAAVFAVGLSAVAPQRVGVLEHLVAVVALVLVLRHRLAVLPSLVVGSDLGQTNKQHVTQGQRHGRKCKESAAGFYCFSSSFY